MKKPDVIYLKETANNVEEIACANEITEAEAFAEML